MAIYLIGGEKGGTGKTTIATNLAAMRVRDGHEVLLVDTDAQASASAWCELRDELGYEVPRVPCVQKFGPSLTAELRALRDKYEDVIVDAGGRNSPELRAAMVIANIVYIPVQASSFDVWTLSSVEALVSASRGFNPDLSAVVILNRVSTNSAVQEYNDAVVFLEEFPNLGLYGGALKDRIAYRKAAKEGLAVSEMQTADDKAVGEMQALYQEVFGG